MEAGEYIVLFLHSYISLINLITENLIIIHGFPSELAASREMRRLNGGRYRVFLLADYGKTAVDMYVHPDRLGGEGER